MLQLQNNSISLRKLQNSMILPAIKYRAGNRIWIAVTIDFESIWKFLKISSTRKNQAIDSELINRFLDPKHKNSIKNYLKEEEQFIIPPITLVSKEPLDFIPLNYGNFLDDTDTSDQTKLLNETGSLVGLLQLPFTQIFTVLDGNHRAKAITEIAEECPEFIAGSQLLLNIVEETSNRKIRQDFVDVNKNAKQTTPSINTLFDTRDSLSSIVADLLDKFEWLDVTTDKLANTISANSKKIYTLNNIKKATAALLGCNVSNASSMDALSKKLKSNPDLKQELSNRASMFFSYLEQNQYIQSSITNYDNIPVHRKSSVLLSGMGILISAQVANVIFNNYSTDQHLLRSHLLELFNFNWSRSNSFWLGVLISEDGTINNSRTNTVLTTDKLLEVLNLSPSNITINN